MMKRLAATGAVAAAMGGVLLTASPALAGGDCHGGGFGCHHKHHDFHHNHHHGFKWYDHNHDHTNIDNHNNNINKPVVVFDHDEEIDDAGLLGG